MRRLWIARLSAAAKASGLSYSKLIHELKNSQILLNRKVLSQLAIIDQKAFEAVVEKATK
jgi:large subunit ribosomal protein L20